MGSLSKRVEKGAIWRVLAVGKRCDLSSGSVLLRDVGEEAEDDILERVVVCPAALVVVYCVVTTLSAIKEAACGAFGRVHQSISPPSLKLEIQ